MTFFSSLLSSSSDREKLSLIPSDPNTGVNAASSEWGPYLPRAAGGRGREKKKKRKKGNYVALRVSVAAAAAAAAEAKGGASDAYLIRHVSSSPPPPPPSDLAHDKKRIPVWISPTKSVLLYCALHETQVKVQKKK